MVVLACSSLKPEVTLNGEKPPTGQRGVCALCKVLVSGECLATARICRKCLLEQGGGGKGTGVRVGNLAIQQLTTYASAEAETAMRG